jgi:DNA-3-methyladenine glycosylase
MQANRGVHDIKRLTNGPGSLVQALGIPPTYSGAKINETRLEFIPPAGKIEEILTSPRVGIKKAVDKPWRFFIS